MKEKDLQKWQKTREQGMATYVLKYGVFAWGIPMFVTMSFIVNKPFADGVTLGKILLHGGIWFTAGVFVGATTWLVFEKMYRKALEKREQL